MTGATGFVGRAVVPLLARQHELICAIRPDTLNAGKAGKKYLFGQNFDFEIMPLSLENILESSAWPSVLKGVDVVVHLAGLAHTPVTSPSVEQYCVQVNYHATRKLALHAARKGVKRFVFVSSANVHGKSREKKQMRSCGDDLAPYDVYTRSKAAAENVLMEIRNLTGMEVVILRPPLVYGPGVKANFFKLLGLVYGELPLPFAGIDNLRSYIALENMAHALALSAVHSQAANQIFLLSDGPGISTSRLLEFLAQAMGKKSRLFPVPRFMMEKALALVRKQGIYERLYLSSWLDSSPIRSALGWEPVLSWQQAMEKTAQWYLSMRQARVKGIK